MIRYRPLPCIDVLELWSFMKEDEQFIKTHGGFPRLNSLSEGDYIEDGWRYSVTLSGVLKLLEGNTGDRAKELLEKFKEKPSLWSLAKGSLLGYREQSDV